MNVKIKLSIVPTDESHFEGLRKALDTVARERRYLAFLQAPPSEEAFAFFQNIVANALCQVVALQDEVVVGWCDVLPTHGEARAHVGTISIGLVPSARHCGIGAKLMETAISKAWAMGYSRIELTVRADNENAKSLYEGFGFTVEGVNRRDFFVDGEFFDAYSMALVH